MEIKIKQEADHVVASLKGQLDTPATEEIQPRIDELLNYASGQIEIDCSGLEYIASSGLRQLISIYKKCKTEGGHMTLIGVCPEVMEIFSVTNFDNVFDIK